MADLTDLVVNCPNVFGHFADKVNTCSAVIGSQHAAELSCFQVPEAYSGAIRSAPILFIGSNPSIDYRELFPTYGWTAEELADFFECRFNREHQWVRDGRRVRRVDGTYGQVVKTWAHIIRVATELISHRRLRYGVDYAITETARCKSRADGGVTKPVICECTDRFFGPTLAASPAAVVIALGGKASAAVSRALGRPNIPRYFDAPIEGTMRTIIHLDYPGARKRNDRPPPRWYLRDVLPTEVLERLRIGLA
jgi:hypothetical protein